MRVRFYIDAATGEPHIAGHGVSEIEVYEVLEGPSEDRPGKNGSRVVIGQTGAGRYLRVVYVKDPQPESIFVITAYDLSAKQLLAFRRRRRKKGK